MKLPTGAMQTFVDAQQQSTVRDECDVIIVGTGAGGSTAARVLSEAGLDVVMVEEGPAVRSENLRPDMYSAFKSMWRDVGFQVAKGRVFTPILQGSCVGGTTVINGAIVHRMPEVIHDRWRTEFGVGSLMSFEALNRAYDTLDRELGVQQDGASDDILGRSNALMEEACKKLGLDGNRIRRNVVGCEGSGRCNQGCAGGRKQSMAVTYVPQALRNGARLFAECKVHRVRSHQGRASGVSGRFVNRETGAQGALFELNARKAVIVSAGAVHTPMLLQKSGVGKRSGMVGRRFQGHPGTGMTAVFDEPVKQWVGATQGYESTHYWSEKMKFEVVGMPVELGSVRVPGYGAELMQQLSDYGHVGVWGAQIRSSAQGRVRAPRFGNRAHIQWEHTTEDVRNLKIGLRRIGDLMFAAGARKVYPGVHGLPETITRAEQLDAMFALPDDPRIFHCIMAHLFATAAMGADPSSHVIAETMESYDLPGLYVMDGSSLPTNMGVNPVHTICAAAWVASERLADSLSA